MKAKSRSGGLKTGLKVAVALLVLVVGGFVALGFMNPEVLPQKVEKSLTLDALKKAS